MQKIGFYGLCWAAVSWLCGCATSASGGQGPGPDGAGAEPDGPWVGQTHGVFHLGCNEGALSLGELADPLSAGPQLAWNGESFIIGFQALDGYRLQMTDGRSIHNSLTLPGMPTVAPPRLIWTGQALRLYYALSESILVDSLAETPALEVVDTRDVAPGPRFDVAAVGDGQVALVSRGRLYLEGEPLHDPGVGFGSTGPLGWNGDNFLAATVLGHGEWWLEGFDADGTPRSPAIDLRFCGVCGPFAPGVAFASSPATGRHALITAAGELTLSIEGHAPITRAFRDGQADASLFVDGDRYLVLLADQLDDAVVDVDAPRRRDIALLPVKSQAPEASAMGEPLVISRAPEDEVRPVGVTAGPGRYGVAWVRGREVVFQHCALAER